jgi:hypothetical protein
MGPPRFDSGTEADSSPDGNRTIAGPVSAKHAPVHDIVALDKSWFYLFNEHDLMWTAPGEIVVDRKQHTVQSLTFMLTVVWNPIRFHVLKTLPKGGKFNAQYYTNDILVIISDWRRQIRRTRPNRFWVRSDNARPHTAKMPKDHISLN